MVVLQKLERASLPAFLLFKALNIQILCIPDIALIFLIYRQVTIRVPQVS